MIKLENLLKENMRRFKTRNLQEQEQLSGRAANHAADVWTQKANGVAQAITKQVAETFPNATWGVDMTTGTRESSTRNVNELYIYIGDIQGTPGSASDWKNDSSIGTNFGSVLGKARIVLNPTNDISAWISEIYKAYNRAADVGFKRGKKGIFGPSGADRRKEKAWLQSKLTPYLQQAAKIDWANMS